MTYSSRNLSKKVGPRTSVDKKSKSKIQKIVNLENDANIFLERGSLEAVENFTSFGSIQ